MNPGAEIRTESQARATLKMGPNDPPSTWRPAFQREAKAAHPDQGGDSERVRLVIDAYNFLKAHYAPKDAQPAGVSGNGEPVPAPAPGSGLGGD